MVLECQGNLFKRLGHFFRIISGIFKENFSDYIGKNCLKNRIKSRMIL